MQKWLLGAVAAAFVLGVSGSGLMAAPGGVGKPTDPPNDTPPRRGDADLNAVSNGHASDRAAARTAEVSPVFGGKSPTVR